LLTLLTRSFIMAHYHLSNEILQEVKNVPFALEKEIQKIFEKNLELIMGLTLVKSEFVIKDKRIDTLAFNSDSNAFIIIEYKLKKGVSVVDQGFTYLNLLLDYKSDFILEYNESLHKDLKRDQVDWSQTRVAFVSTHFTDNQKQATSFQDMAIELWEVKRFTNGSILIDSIRRAASAPLLKPLVKEDSTLDKIISEIRIVTEDDMLSRGTDTTIELYQQFKSALMNLYPEFDLQPKLHYLAFKI